MKNSSVKNMLNNNEPSIEPSGYQKCITNHVLYELVNLVLCFLSDK